MSDYKLVKTEAGVGAKPSDFWTVPLCGRCHQEQHLIGEIKFWAKHERDPFRISLALWALTGDVDAGTKLIERN